MDTKKGDYEKTVVRKSATAVTVVKRRFNKAGMEIEQENAKIGVINYDPEITTKDAVYNYAITREWDLAEDPASVTRTGTPMYKTIDLGDKEELAKQREAAKLEGALEHE